MTNRQTPKVLIIVPAYNEEKNIVDVISGILQLQKLFSNMDLIVIDDGSKDRTAQIAESKGVKVIMHAQNLGEEGAIQTGFTYALKHGYDHVVKIDADGQHEVMSIPHILKPLVENRADVVIGARSKDYRELQIFKLGRVFCSILISVLTRKRITDPTSGFKGRSRSAVRYSRHIYTTTELFHDDTVNDLEEILLYFRRGFKIIEVPIRMKERKEISKCYFSRRLIGFPPKLLSAIIKCLAYKDVAQEKDVKDRLN